MIIVMILIISITIITITITITIIRGLLVARRRGRAPGRAARRTV